MDFIKNFKAARAVSTPLIAVRTPDPASTIRSILDTLTGEASKTPVLYWDVMKGITGVNASGKQEAKRILNDGDPAMVSARPAEALEKAEKVQKETILFMANTHLYWEDSVASPPVIQGIWNLRDNYKAKGSTLVMFISAGAFLPAELAGDVLVLDEPLPGKPELKAIVDQTFDDAGLPKPTAKDVTKAIDALIGLAAFPAEQTLAMSLSAKGLKYDQLWERKRKVVEQTRGLSVWRGGAKFPDIGGCENAKSFFGNLLKGNEPPNVVVFMDEIEKMFAGAGTDLSGVKTELLGAFLTWMEDRKAMGSLFIGPPGSGKTMLGRAIGNEADLLTVGMDVAAMQSSLVGSSGENFRNGLKVVDAVAGGQPILVIGTCNSIGSLPPEVRRRFTLGTFFFDLPSKEERETIWKMYTKQFGVDGKQDTPKDEGWTGAEIRNCCQQAYRLNITLKQAANYVIPVATSAKDQIEGLRKAASGKFISASKAGTYEHNELPEISTPKPARWYRVDPEAVGEA